MTRTDFVLIFGGPLLLIAVVAIVGVLVMRCHWAPSSDSHNPEITGLTCHFLER